MTTDCPLHRSTAALSTATFTLLAGLTWLLVGCQSSGIPSISGTVAKPAPSEDRLGVISQETLSNRIDIHHDERFLPHGSIWVEAANLATLSIPEYQAIQDSLVQHLHKKGFHLATNKRKADYRATLLLSITPSQSLQPPAAMHDHTLYQKRLQLAIYIHQPTQAWQSRYPLHKSTVSHVGACVSWPSLYSMMLHSLFNHFPDPPGHSVYIEPQSTIDCLPI